jgi:sugar lactone lactonase YvrE
MWSRPMSSRISLALLPLLLFLGGAAPKWEPLLDKDRAPFITALAQDRDGNIWIGTEDKGVFRYNPSADELLQWSNFTTRDGLGDDNAYAIACDKLGRVWVGTLNHGVSVFNGDKWKTYGVLDGPIGERIFSIAICPTDNDVWLATSAGLTRYSLSKDAWQHYTKADGLPEEQANAIAFDDQGNIFVGTQCYGIATARTRDDYNKWTVISGADTPSLIPMGKGLPSNQINALLVSRNGTILAGTSSGLAWSTNGGKIWEYVRGRDYAAKVRSRLGGAPRGWTEAPAQVLERLLPEDYVTCLAEDDAGSILVGFRREGVLSLNLKTKRFLHKDTNKGTGLPEDYVFAVLPLPKTTPLIGSYGGGLFRRSPQKKVDSEKPSGPEEQSPALPKPALAPKEYSLPVATGKGGAPSKEPIVISLADDWTTQGDFFGKSEYSDYRYGEGLAHLCAFASPFDSEWGRRPTAFQCWGRTGSNGRKGEALRHWVHWRNTNNRRALKNPFAPGRCQAEWDDHKEEYL